EVDGGDSRGPTRKSPSSGRGTASRHGSAPSPRRAQGRVRFAQLLRRLAARRGAQRAAREGCPGRLRRTRVAFLREALPERDEAASPRAPAGSPGGLVAPGGLLGRLLLRAGRPLSPLRAEGAAGGARGEAGLMTPEGFRRLALRMPEASESAHMGHPDFRVRGKIFATLSYPDESWGMVKLTPEQQEAFV